VGRGQRRAAPSPGRSPCYPEGVTPASALRLCLAALLLGPLARAQGPALDAWLADPSGSALGQRLPVRASGLETLLEPYGPPPSAPAPRTGLAWFEHDPLAEQLAALVSPLPPPVDRSTLDETPEGDAPTVETWGFGASAGEDLRYARLPGGIVLGLDARPVGPAARACRGALLESSSDGHPQLHLVDGSVLRLPQLSSEGLAACLDFVLGSRSDALIDLRDGRARIAPAFGSTPLGTLLIAQDELPHGRIAGSRSWKSLIVDRAARFERVGDELQLSAELEVRFYAGDPATGRARRALTLDGADPRFGQELAPLRELAAWIAFLRWTQQSSPLARP